MIHRFLPSWLPSAVLLVVLWLLVFNQQRLEWSVNVVYAYGWAVPAMAGYLLWERWRTRPAAKVLPRAFELVLLGVAALLLAAYLPVRVVQEANPDWVKINWSFAALAVGLTLVAFTVTGGLRYARHFFFPLLFCFTALPWPVWVDNWLVQSLMRVNASVCAELLTLFGTPAMAEGNLIQVADRWVNVEEACSGIRSLQTAFMMSLFLGELHRLPKLRRLGLVAASFGVALLLNIFRTLMLTRLTVEEAGLVERWHDPVGVVVMVLCLVALWGLSEWIRPHASAAVPPTTPATPPLAPGRAFAGPFPLLFALAGIVWVVAAEAATGAWYAYHERRVPPSLAWDVVWPGGAPQFERGEFAERTLALLKFNEGKTASWLAEHAYPMQMYSLRWDPGRVSKHLSSSHHPTVCLPATGLNLVRELGRWECVVNGVRLPFSTYLFEQGGNSVYVFHALIEERPLYEGEAVVYRQVDTTERLQSVLRGERNLGQRVVGIALLGVASSEDARDIVFRELGAVVRPVTQPVVETSL